VSIVVPAYNREKFLAATVDSVLGQTLTAWELVVVDDGSTDGTAQVAQRYAERDARISFITTANGGVATARNRGFERTDPRSEYVGFLDSDDIWEPDTLARLSGVLDARPSAVAAHGLARCIDDEGRRHPNDKQEAWMRARKEWRDGQLRSLEADEPTSFEALAVENWVVTPGTMLIRRDAMQRVGPLDPRTAPADDWELGLRLSRIGEIAFVDHVVLSWRRHQTTLSETSANWRRAYFRVRDKLLADPANSPAQSRVARVTYRNVNRGSWREAWAELRRRNLSGAARRVARAVEGQARYLRAVIASARR
jgi:glycosyltransferase involved in cell wall biosynthesis